MKSTLVTAAAVALLISLTGCGSSEGKDTTDDELALLDQKLSQMTPAQACQELFDLCATQAKGCIAHDLFCTPKPPPGTICQQLGDLCAQGSQTACQIFGTKCGPSADAGPPPVCGDKACSPGETCKSCPKDCGVCSKDFGPVHFDVAPPPKCGNKVCESGETCKSCPLDCGPCISKDGGPIVGLDASPPPKCGNKLCQAGETCKTCPLDCGPCGKDFGPPVHADYAAK